jgi:hypothetical protein
MEYPHRVRVVAGIIVVLVIVLATIAVLKPARINRQSGDIALDMPMPLSKCEKITKQQVPSVGDRTETPLTCRFSPGKDLSGWRVTITPDQKKAELVVSLENSTSSTSQKIALGVKAVQENSDIYFWDGYVNFAHDVNQDGYRDMRLVNSVGTANALSAADVFFDYWLFNPKKLVYEKSSDLKSIPNAYFNPNTNTVNGTIATGEKSLTEIRYRYIDGYFARSEARRVKN